MSTAPNPPASSQVTPLTVPQASAHNFWPFLVALAGVAGLAELAYAIVGVSELSVYLDKGLGLSGIVGMSFGAFYLSEAVLNSPMGTLADRLGRRRLMVLGALASVFTCIGLAFLRVPPGPYGLLLAGAAVLLMRLVDGAGAAALWPAVFASVGDRVEEARRTTAMSALTMTYFAGMAFGPMVGGLANEYLAAKYAENDPHRYMPSLLISASLFLVTAIAAFFVAPPRSSLHSAKVESAPDASPVAPDAHGGAFSLDATKNTLKRFPFLMLLAFVTFLSVGLIIPYVKLFVLERFGIGESAFAKLLLYPALLIGVIAVPTGRFADKIGKVMSVRVGMGACALALWIMLTISSTHAVIAAGALLGLGFLMAFPAYMAFLSDLTGPSERGGTLGAVRAAQGVGAFIGTIFSSLLFNKVGEEAPFYVAAALLTLAFTLSLVFIKKPVAASV